MWGALGDPNASIPTPQPVLMRPALTDAVAGDLSVSFVAPAAIEDGLADRLGLRRRLAAVRSTRDVGKAQMINNDALPRIEIKPDSFEISIDGESVVPAPADGPAAGAAVHDVLTRSGSLARNPLPRAEPAGDAARCVERARPAASAVARSGGNRAGGRNLANGTALAPGRGTR